MATQLKPGDKVKVTGYPRLFAWMEQFVGREATVVEVGHRAIAVDFGDDILWLGKSFVELVEDEEVA